MGFLTGNNSIDSLLAGDGYRWNAAEPVGTATVISYSFLDALPGYYASGSPEANGFAAVTDAMKAGIRTALNLYEQVCNVRFVEDDSGTGQITFAQCNLSGVASSSYGGDTGKAGDIFFNVNSAAMQTMSAGSYGFLTALHEIGHALGLKHPGNYDGSSGRVPGPYLPAATDSVQYSVMSYYGNTLDAANPQTLQLYDIQALQYLYGANRTTATGSDVYTVAVGAPEIRTIWDGGGTDTLSAAGQTAAAWIDLNAGAFSSIGVDAAGKAAISNIAIAFGVTIENAAGGAGDDTLIGNAVDNRLTGGAGNDVLDGGAGSDTAVYSGIRSQYRVWADNGRIVVQDLVDGRDGTDKLVNVEHLRFADGEVLAADAAGPLAGTAVSRNLGIGRTVALSDLYSAGNSDGRTIEYYWVTNPAGAGTVNLNGAVNLATAVQQMAGGVQVSAADFAKLTYTGNGSETLTFQAFDGVNWSAAASANLTNSGPGGTGTPTTLARGQSVALSALYTAADADGDSIRYYRVTNPAGAGTVNLNGAVNLANATQQAQGMVTVSAADFAKLTYTGGGAETLTFEAHDGIAWGDATSVAIGNAAPVGTGAPTALARGRTVALSTLYSATDAEDTIQYYRVTNPAGAGTVNLNGAVNLANATQQAQGMVTVSAADFAKLTYTGGGAETLTFEAHDGNAWGDATAVAIGNATPVGTGAPTTLARGRTVALTTLYTATDGEDTIQYYRVTNPAGAGTVNLNGAVNLANATQQAQGMVTVSAADFAKLTYTGGGAETLTFEAHDGNAWGDATAVAITHLTGTAASRSLAGGGTVALTSLYAAADPDGNTGSIQYYRVINPAGAGSISLNGAVNLANATQQAQGMVTVSAADFAKLTYTGNGSETLAFAAHDGVGWNAEATATITNATPIGTAVPQTLRNGQTVALTSLYSATDPEDGIRYYRVTNPAGAGTIGLNGAVNLANTTQQAQGMVTVAAADFAKLTYTGKGGETLTFEAHDGIAWNTASQVTITLGAILAGTGNPRSLSPGQQIPVFTLYEADGRNGDANRYYRIADPRGSGTIELNGAANLASAADRAMGIVQVSAADYYKVTYTGATGETLSFQAGDGVSWSVATDVTLTEGAPAAVLPARTIKIGETVSLASLVQPEPPDLAPFAHYGIWDYFGTGTFNLNGAVNTLSDYNIMNPEVHNPRFYWFSKEDFSKVTYTGNGSTIFYIHKTYIKDRYEDAIKLPRDGQLDTAVISNKAPEGTVSPLGFKDGVSLRLSDLYSAQDTEGDSIKKYRVRDPAGAGRINLNGATNISSAEDIIGGYYTVFAAEFSRLTYDPAGAEELIFQASDGGSWSAPKSAILGAGDRVETRKSIPYNLSVSLESLFAPGTLRQNGASYYRVSDPAGAGMLAYSYPDLESATGKPGYGGGYSRLCLTGGFGRWHSSVHSGRRHKNEVSRCRRGTHNGPGRRCRWGDSIPAPNCPCRQQCSGC